MDADDYNGLDKTYPEHPISKNITDVKTKVELAESRKNIEKADIERKKSERDARVAHLQKVQFKDYHQPQEYVDKPPFNSTWEK